jgi:cardiolipin synthase A/B
MGWFLMAVGVAFLLWFVVVTLFTPRIDYHVTTPLRPGSAEFLHVLQSICEATFHYGNRAEVFTNGGQFYPAMRDAIRAARESVNLEAYIFQPGEAADLLIEALVERASQGVEVRLVLDAVGSARLTGEPLRRLRDAGCQVCFYQPLTWYRLHRINNRTHRELLVVDGRVAFTGGAGVADWWHRPTPPMRLARIGEALGRRPHVGRPAWRDMMIRLDGPIVAALQGVFAENWLECTGEILTSPRHWPPIDEVGEVPVLLVRSSPSDRSTESRVAFQTLIEGAVSAIDIATPYFLPDRALRRALVRAAQRGVRVRVVVPGPLTDQRLVRLASRRMWHELLPAGVRIFEYRPGMTHVKALMIDEGWAIAGTTNLDNRSFEHNDEVNVAFMHEGVTARLRADFESDIAASDEITMEHWQRRPFLEKLVGPACWILERQQ